MFEMFYVFLIVCSLSSYVLIQSSTLHLIKVQNDRRSQDTVAVVQSCLTLTASRRDGTGEWLGLPMFSGNPIFKFPNPDQYCVVYLPLSPETSRFECLPYLLFVHILRSFSLSSVAVHSMIQKCVECGRPDPWRKWAKALRLDLCACQRRRLARAQIVISGGTRHSVHMSNVLNLHTVRHAVYECKGDSNLDVVRDILVDPLTFIL
ncbi:hypothetical protein K1T71_001109 [Dendrolimus kikuchii]|uniref:Uncharacterized protein n=1 Tax=Dendrolimus kikuchii TaxID=765133 RepID=A0ACC1DHJ5_9NEOP|nr:hypothetical protein K1T71_001109 [Dendrolimus kikuchii]